MQAHRNFRPLSQSPPLPLYCRDLISVYGGGGPDGIADEVASNSVEFCALGAWRI